LKTELKSKFRQFCSE